MINSIYRRLKKVTLGLKVKYFKSEGKVVEKILVGVPLKTVTGTIRSKADQDDAWYFHIAGNSKHIFDIGANIGYTALLTNIQGKTEKLLLIDPNPQALSIAAKNLILNNLAGNCTFLASFVSNQIGTEIPFFTVGSGAAGSMYKGHAKSAAALGSIFLVPTITIDELVTRYGWQPDLVKIDVEGAESLVLQGAAQLASAQHTTFMVEMHSPPELSMRKNAEQILEWCQVHKYQAWYMKNGEKLQSPEQIAHRGKCHLLLLPVGRQYPESLKKIEQRAALPNSI